MSRKVNEERTEELSPYERLEAELGVYIDNARANKDWKRVVELASRLIEAERLLSGTSVVEAVPPEVKMDNIAVVKERFASARKALENHIKIARFLVNHTDGISWAADEASLLARYHDFMGKVDSVESAIAAAQISDQILSQLSEVEQQTSYTQSFHKEAWLISIYEKIDAVDKSAGKEMGELLSLEPILAVEGQVLSEDEMLNLYNLGGGVVGGGTRYKIEQVIEKGYKIDGRVLKKPKIVLRLF